MSAAVTSVVWRTSSAAVAALTGGRSATPARHPAGQAVIKLDGLMLAAALSRGRRWMSARDGSCCQNVIRICRTDTTPASRLQGHLPAPAAASDELLSQSDTRSVTVTSSLCRPRHHQRRTACYSQLCATNELNLTSMYTAETLDSLCDFISPSKQQ